jgi:hypothetical protein
MFSARLIHSLRLILLLCGMFSLALARHDTLYPAINAAEVRFGDGGAAAHSVGTAPDAEDRFAWDEFTSLVHPSVENRSKISVDPEWVKWKNKCEAGLTNSCQIIAPRLDSNVRVDAASAGIPRQVLLDFGDSKTKDEETAFVQAYLQVPQLASVLFNPEAAASIRRSNLGQRSMLDLAIGQLDADAITGADRRLPTGSFSLGSEIVKLVWEIVPATQDLALFDPENVPLEPGINQLFHVPSWLARYVIDPDNNKPCPLILPQYGSPDKPVKVPINCFYWFKVHGAETCDSLSSEVVQVWCQPPLENQDFYAVLVAFHVMKLVATNPNWIWMTYYWTRNANDGETANRIKWAAPWNHFHEYSTTAIREEAPSGHQICFNPYLEGTDPNGVKANCLSCHSFSAYSPASSKMPDGTKLGATYPYPLSRRKWDENQYFAGSIQTALVWSISTNQDSTTQALLNSFESALASAILNQRKLR